MIRNLVIPTLCAIALAGCFSSENASTSRAESVEAQKSKPAPKPVEAAARPATDGPGCIAEACEPGEVPPPEAQKNARGEELQPCSTDPMTGWFRDGYCRTDARDRGVHVVCGVMTDDFLSYTKAQGNDLSTPRGSFPGLAPGDRWCLCASRWEQARQAGKATPVVLDATNQKAARLVEKASETL